MSGRRWMFLALARSGWGEAVLGLRIARRLVARGDRVVFVVHPVLAKLFRHAPVRVEVLGSERGPGLGARLRRLLAFHRTEAVVLSDLLMTVTALLRRGAPEALALDLPIIGIDTWHLRELDGRLDTQPDELLTLAPHLVRHPRSLVPVPFARPDAANAAVVLPDGAPLSDAAKAAARAELGLPSRPLVAIATAGWQHRDYGDPRVEAFQAWMPARLGAALREIDADVVHVGPRPLALDGVAVHHRDRLPAPDFERLLGSVDVLLSTNASATTNATAAVYGVPIVTVVHTGAPTPSVPWPFQAWPTGWHQALTTLLRHNPWSEVLNRREALEEGSLEVTLASYLPGDWGRDGALERAATALDALRAVDPPEVVLDRQI